ncbi:hypothetical protein HDU79_004873 [Rhizoclosmatium sp. JEL0117]|nr:hypothetical protein HDU79_004873 [Rhizoclosmatium sp. JEL0117]
MAAPTPAVATISADEQQPIELKKYEETVEQPEQVDGKKKKNQHQLINDKLIQRAAIGVFLLLCVSWSFQWASIIIPAWRGDRYHTGGLFEICGNTDFQLDNKTLALVPGPSYPWKCEPFNDYVDRFAKIYDGVNTGQLNAQYQALNAKKMIVVSRWFEIISTSLDMIFGVTTIWAVVYPHVEREKQKMNMKFAIIGVLLTPTFTIIDSFIQNSYWGFIGVGVFEHSVNSYLYISGDMNWISSFSDFILQLGFLAWGVRRQYQLAQGGNEIAQRGVV